MEFDFTTFVAMLSAILTLMVDSFAMTRYKKRSKGEGEGNGNGNLELQTYGHSHGSGVGTGGSHDEASQLLQYRVVAQV